MARTLKSEKKKRSSKRKESASASQASKRIKCEKCEKTFSKISNLKQHEKKQHQGRVFICPYCEENQSSKYAHIRHIRRKHKNKSIGNTSENENYIQEDKVVLSDAAKDALIKRLTGQNETQAKTIVELKAKLHAISNACKCKKGIPNPSESTPQVTSSDPQSCSVAVSRGRRARKQTFNNIKN